MEFSAPRGFYMDGNTAINIYSLPKRRNRFRLMLLERNCEIKIRAPFLSSLYHYFHLNGIFQRYFISKFPVNWTWNRNFVNLIKKYSLYIRSIESGIEALSKYSWLHAFKVIIFGSFLSLTFTCESFAEFNLKRPSSSLALLPRYVWWKIWYKRKISLSKTHQSINSLECSNEKLIGFFIRFL